MTNTTTVLITGNTYPVKEQIKALGGRWDAANKGWRVPPANAAQAQALVSDAPRSTYSAPSKSRYARRPGKWTGCSCGSREIDGELVPSRSNCDSCNHDAF